MGEKHYRLMSVSLGQGFILGSIFCIFSIIVFWFAEPILIFIDIAPENAHLTGKMVVGLIPGIILQTVNFQ